MNDPRTFQVQLHDMLSLVKVKMALEETPERKGTLCPLFRWTVFIVFIIIIIIIVIIIIIIIIIIFTIIIIIIIIRIIIIIIIIILIIIIIISSASKKLNIWNRLWERVT